MPDIKHSFDMIADRLAGFRPEEQVGSGRTHAAVALILREAECGLEILFIERASDDQDPWSGHIAFPGGKLEMGELVRQAAERETLEEIGIDLKRGRYLGRLSDIIGANLPVRVSCCVFALEEDGAVVELSDEVSSLLWCRLPDLRDSARHRMAMVAFGDRRLEVPSIQLPWDGKPVLWGITYRIVTQFLGLIENLEQGLTNGDNSGILLPQALHISEEDRL